MTAQIEEVLILDGEITSMAYCPPLPTEPGLLIPTEIQEQRDGEGLRVVETWIDPQGKRHYEEADFFTGSTACWRGYVATWELADGQLFLNEIRGGYRLASESRLFAEWVTGVLRIKLGKRLCYVHMGFGTVTERELHIHIENGLETGRREIDNRGKSHDQWSISAANLPGRENRFPGDGQLND